VGWRTATGVYALNGSGTCLRRRVREGAADIRVGDEGEGCTPIALPEHAILCITETACP
jgi:hypothetical protein